MNDLGGIAQIVHFENELMKLNAISIGYAVPQADFEAAIHSVFKTSLNLKIENNEYLITIFSSAEDNLPQGIHFQAPHGFSFEKPKLGERVICSKGIISLGWCDLTINLHLARLWKCNLSSLLPSAAPSAIFAAWRSVWQSLNEYQRIVGAEIIAQELLGNQELSRYQALSVMRESMRVLLSAAQNYDLKINQALETLIGLGGGLTPSGDDVLMGYLAGLWCGSGQNPIRQNYVKEFSKIVLQFLHRTNDISRTYLYHATQGQVSSRLADLAGLICIGDKTPHLLEVAKKAMRVGHTSGMDAVTGLLLGLGVWNNLLPE